MAFSRAPTKSVSKTSFLLKCKHKSWIEWTCVTSGHIFCRPLGKKLKNKKVFFASEQKPVYLISIQAVKAFE